MVRSCAYLAAPLLAAMVVAACAPRDSTGARPIERPAAEIPAPEIAPEIAAHLREGERRVTAFFEEGYPRPFETRVFPDRKALDAFVADRWKMPPTECWMVAMGAGPIMVLLDPAAWRAQACEHDGTDERHVREIVTHELVHVFHGQHGPRPEFDGMDETGWFLEGLAIYVAGQLDATRERQAREAAAAGRPTSRAQARSGTGRYAVAGSLVRYVDQTYGRAALKAMLRAVSNEELLATLGTTEERLLADWRASVR